MKIWRDRIGINIYLNSSRLKSIEKRKPKNKRNNILLSHLNNFLVKKILKCKQVNTFWVKKSENELKRCQIWAKFWKNDFLFKRLKNVVIDLTSQIGLSSISQNRDGWKNNLRNFVSKIFFWILTLWSEKNKHLLSKERLSNKNVFAIFNV